MHGRGAHATGNARETSDESQRRPVERHPRLPGDLLERVDLRGGEQQAAELLAPLGRFGFRLPGEHALLVAVVQYVAQHGLDVLVLRAAERELAGKRLRADALEEE